MKRLTMMMVGAVALVMTFAGTASAGGYTNEPTPTTVIQGGGGGTAFTGGNIAPALMIGIALLVVGLTAVFFTRRRAASNA